jgi:hypothetical protein
LKPRPFRQTFRVLIETMAGHDLNHLQHIEGIGWSGAIPAP